MCLPLELCDTDLLTIASSTLTASTAGRSLFARVFTQAFAGLAHCHAVGVYHLDVKPDNLLMVGDGVVKLADWGYAVRHGASERLGSAATVAFAGAGAATHNRDPVLATDCGTVEYAAPEALHASRANAAAKKLGERGAAAEGGSSPTARRSGSRGGVGTSRGGGSCSPSSSGLLGRVVNKCRVALTGRPALDRVYPHDAMVDAGGIVSPSAASTLVSFDAEKADVWSLGLTMLVVMTGYYPWRSASPTDSRYSQWLSAWRKVGRVHPLTSPPGRPPLSSSGGGGGAKPRTPGGAASRSPSAASGNTGYVDCESVGINSAAPSAVSSRTSSPLLRSTIFEHCRSPPASPVASSPGSGLHGSGTVLTIKLPLRQHVDTAGGHRTGLESPLGPAVTDVTFGLAAVLHNLTQPAEDASGAKGTSTTGTGLHHAGSAALDTEPCRRAILQLIASMLNPDPTQRIGLSTAHRRLLEILGHCDPGQRR